MRSERSQMTSPPPRELNEHRGVNGTLAHCLDPEASVVVRHAIVIGRLATEFHALLMVLTQRGVATLDAVRAAERKSIWHLRVARAQELADMTRDLERLDQELDDKDRRADPK